MGTISSAEREEPTRLRRETDGWPRTRRSSSGPRFLRAYGKETRVNVYPFIEAEKSQRRNVTHGDWLTHLS